MYMHLKKYIQLFGILSAVCLVSACSNEDIPKNEDTPNDENGSVPVRTVNASIKAFQMEGETSSLPGEDSISDMQACLFEEGVLTTVYTEFSKKESQYVLQTDKPSGHLYLVGNTDGQLDLQAMKEQKITEEMARKYSTNVKDFEMQR